MISALAGSDSVAAERVGGVQKFRELQRTARAKGLDIHTAFPAAVRLLGEGSMDTPNPADMTFAELDGTTKLPLFQPGQGSR